TEILEHGDLPVLQVGRHNVQATVTIQIPQCNAYQVIGRSNLHGTLQKHRGGEGGSRQICVRTDILIDPNLSVKSVIEQHVRLPIAVEVTDGNRIRTTSSRQIELIA